MYVCGALNTAHPERGAMPTQERRPTTSLLLTCYSSCPRTRCAPVCLYFHLNEQESRTATCAELKLLHIFLMANVVRTLQATFTTANTLTMQNVSATAQFYGKGEPIGMDPVMRVDRRKYACISMHRCAGQRCWRNLSVNRQR